MCKTVTRDETMESEKTINFVSLLGMKAHLIVFVLGQRFSPRQLYPVLISMLYVYFIIIVKEKC